METFTGIPLVGPPSGGYKPGDHAIIGFQQVDIPPENLPADWPQGVEAVEKVVRVRMFFDDHFVDEDFVWPTTHTVEELVGLAAQERMKELRDGVTHENSKAIVYVHGNKAIKSEQVEPIKQDWNPKRHTDENAV